MTMPRRSVLLSLGVSPFCFSSVFGAGVVDLQGLAAVIDSASAAIGHLADFVGNAITHREKRLDKKSAEIVLTRLKDIDANLTILAQDKNGALISAVTDYIALAKQSNSAPDALHGAWLRVITDIHDVLTSTQHLLDALRAERSDLVLEDTYGVLLGALRAKVGVLSQLEMSDPPKGAQAISELEALDKRFEALRAQTIRATKEVSNYIKKNGG